MSGSERVSNYRKRQKAELETLRAEVAGLRAEVAFLRSQQSAHVCPTWPQPIPCTCGQSQGCQAHPFPKPTVFCWQPAAGAAAPVGTSYWLNTVGATTTTVQFNSPMANACAGPQPMLTFNVPA